MREKYFFHAPNRCAQHSPDEKRGGEHSAGRSAGKGNGRGHDFQDGQRQQDMPQILAVHGMIDDLVPGAHHLGKTEEADASDEQAGGGGKHGLRPARERTQPRSQGAKQS